MFKINFSPSVRSAILLTGVLALFLMIAAPASAAEKHSRVADDAWSIQPLLTGAPAPHFTATAANGSSFAFDPDALERPAIIVFYRGGWCPYCNLHFAELREAEEELLALNMDLIFLSADSPETLAEAHEMEEELDYFLLSDNSTEIAQAFGIAFRVPDSYVGRLKQHNIDLQAASGYDHQVLPAPAVFIVANGRIEFSYVNPDFKVRLHPDVLLAAARTMPGRTLTRD